MSYFYTYLFCLFYFLISLQTKFTVASKNATSISKSNSTCHQNEDAVYLITGGYLPTVNTLGKYAVSIRRRNQFSYNYNNYFGSTHFCGGTILNSRLILTAAHCLKKDGHRLRPSALEVVTGTPRRLLRTSHTQINDVSKVIVHSRYDQKRVLYDIGLLQLTTPIDLDGQYTAAIPLPQAPPYAGEACVSIGWGKLFMDGPYSNSIVYVNLTIQDNSRCKRRVPLFANYEICASNPTDNEKDSCKGDSGGPFICNGTIVGVVSYGYGCGIGIPGVYTDVYEYIDWITKSKCATAGASLGMLWFLGFMQAIVS